MKTKSYEIDMCNGPLTGKLLKFAVPLMFSGILQLLFNAADIVVVGRFAGHEALAAVGSTGSLINLLVNLFVGLSLGANVVAARCFGAKDDHGVQDTVQTSVTLGLVSGVLLAVVGFFAARGLLELMSCPEDVIDLSALYLKIYFIGMPMTMLYNFSSALLRAVGDNATLVTTLAKDRGTVKILGLVISNALVAFGGCIVCHETRSFSATMGTGQLVYGLAAVIIGVSIIHFYTGTRLARGLRKSGPLRFLGSPQGTTAVVLGSVLYKLCIQVAMSLGLPTNMMKLITAALFLLVLVLSGRKGEAIIHA